MEYISFRKTLRTRSGVPSLAGCRAARLQHKGSADIAITDSYTRAWLVNGRFCMSQGKFQRIGRMDVGKSSSHHQSQPEISVKSKHKTKSDNLECSISR